jgi:NitT/TauT family transport system permease protein
MAETGVIRTPLAAAARSETRRQVWMLRVAILVVVVVIWEVVSASGWLFRDVVPSLLTIGSALFRILTPPDM